MRIIEICVKGNGNEARGEGEDGEPAVESYPWVVATLFIGWASAVAACWHEFRGLGIAGEVGRRIGVREERFGGQRGCEEGDCE